MRVYLFLLLFKLTAVFSQQVDRALSLDSINRANCSSRGAFNLYIKKIKLEGITGLYRNREEGTNFAPINFTGYVYLPFQYDLSYVHLKAREKILKLNPLFIIHVTNYGNYATGLANRFSFLLIKKTYLSYQLGLVWCETTNPKAPDGINYMGFCFHHNISFSYALSKKVEANINLLHISNGNIFTNVENLQDVIGLGVAYQF